MLHLPSGRINLSKQKAFEIGLNAVEFDNSVHARGQLVALTKELVPLICVSFTTLLIEQKGATNFVAEREAHTTGS